MLVHSQTEPTPQDMEPLQTLYKELLAPIKNKLEYVEEEIRRELHSDIEVISRMSEYLARTKGKRIRPALFLLCARLLGVKSDRDVALAAVIEFLHTATLIHDDIIDTADTRRGKATINAIWGNELTVLLGDYLYLRGILVADSDIKRTRRLEHALAGRYPPPGKLQIFVPAATVVILVVPIADVERRIGKDQVRERLALALQPLDAIRTDYPAFETAAHDVRILAPR